MIKNIWVEIKRKKHQNDNLVGGGGLGLQLVKQPFQAEGGNGRAYPDIDHKSGTETEARYRSDKELCLSRLLQEVSQLKAKHWIHLTDNFIFWKAEKAMKGITAEDLILTSQEGTGWQSGNNRILEEEGRTSNSILQSVMA